jgi:hypothetical protein
VSSKSSKLLHLDPLAIALERRKKAEEQSTDNEEPKKGPTLVSEPNTSSQPVMGNQPILSSQLTEQPRGGPVSNQPILSKQANTSSQPNTSSLLPSDLNLLASAPEIKGTSRIPHRYTDHLCRLLKPDEQAVYWQLYRLSWGWNKETCFISNPRLSERSNVPLSSMKRAVTGLIQKGLVEKTGHTNGYGKDQGVEYRVPILDRQPSTGRQAILSSQPNMAPIKENNTQINTHTETLQQTQKETEGAVGVGSKFSIEECRRYAEHLRASGQGINNPGGYATTIHRTGEADALIESFLKPSPSSGSVDVSKCTDCGGTGFYYPEGKEKGMAKCKHPRLSEEQMQ